MDVKVGLWRKLCAEELMLLNCDFGEDSFFFLKSPLNCKEFQPVPSKGEEFWVFFGRNDAKAETPVLWPPHNKSWLIGKDSYAGRDWGQEEKGTTEDEVAGWHHPLDGCEFEWTPGVVDGQGGLACCNSWGRKESDTTEQLNWTEMRIKYKYCSLMSMLFPLGHKKRINNMVKTQKSKPRQTVRQALLAWKTVKKKKNRRICWGKITQLGIKLT